MGSRDVRNDSLEASLAAAFQLRLGVCGLSLASVLSFACAAAPVHRSTTPGEPVAMFPSAAELETAGGEAAGEATTSGAFPTLEVERWDLDPAAMGSNRTEILATPWDSLLAQRVAPGESQATHGQTAPFRVSSDLACMARESARFFVQHGAFPGEALRAYSGARCGSTLPSVSLATLSVEVPDGASERDVIAQFSKGMESLFSPLAAGVAAVAGLGYARGRGRAAVVLAYGLELAHLEQFAQRVEGAGFHVRGTIEGPVQSILALVNHGPLGVRRCEFEAGVELPRFACYCPLDDSDGARVEVVVRRPGRALFETVVSTFVHRTDQAGLSYQPASFGPDAEAADPLAFSEALLAALAAARVRSGGPPLVLEARQSEINRRLAPPLFAAIRRRQMELADRISLGVLAGWEVETVIGDGGLIVSGSSSERRPARWLASTLASPFGRYILLDPRMTRVAVGAARLGPGGIGAAVSTYAPLGPASGLDPVAIVTSALTRARAAFGRSRPRFRAPGPALADALARIRKDRIAAQAALRDLVGAIQRGGDANVQGWSLETLELSNLPFPPELTQPGNIEIEFGVTQYRPNGAAWAQYALLFVIHHSTRSVANVRSTGGRQGARTPPEETPTVPRGLQEMRVSVGERAQNFALPVVAREHR